MPGTVNAERPVSPEAFARALADVALPDVFNPYTDRCAVHDLPDAAAIRRDNLVSYLGAVQRSGTDMAWMGRDLGHRGGRRTGRALTDEAQLANVPACYRGTRVNKATVGPILAERTATEVWAALRVVAVRPLLWNVFPLHPHQKGAPLTNRAFSKRELARVEELNRELIKWLGLRTVVCIGQDAAAYAIRLGVAIKYLRHPSYGGVREFREGIERLYGVAPSRESRLQRELFAGQTES